MTRPVNPPVKRPETPSKAQFRALLRDIPSIRAKLADTSKPMLIGDLQDTLDDLCLRSGFFPVTTGEAHASMLETLDAFEKSLSKLITLKKTDWRYWSERENLHWYLKSLQDEAGIIAMRNWRAGHANANVTS
jgi:hypothetical protein